MPLDFYHLPSDLSLSKSDWTVILPCAGVGSRLGLTTPKELYEISPGTKLIDCVLEHILESATDMETSLRVVVVIRKGKQSVAEYVGERLSPIETIKVFPFVLQDDTGEWPESVFAPLSCFSDHNLLLLPDGFLSLSVEDPYLDAEGRTLLENMRLALQDHALSLGTLPCNAREKLSSLGAVRLTASGSIVDWEDKPSAPGKFNAIWGCMAFRQEITASLARFVSDSVRKKAEPFNTQSFCPAKAVLLTDYQDLGTWPNIEAFRNTSCLGSKKAQY